MQVERQRHDPQQRNRGDVLRDVVGHREQQRRAGCRQRAPEQLAAQGRRARSAVASSPGRAAAAASTLPRRRRPPLRARPAAHSPTNDRIARRPSPRLHARGDPRLEQERVAQQRQHRREIRQREQPIRAASGKACARTTPGPAGWSWTARNRAARSWRRAAPGSARSDFPAPVGFQNAPGTIGSTARLSTSSTMCSFACGARREPAHGKVGVGVAEQQRRLKEDEARRPHRRGAAEPRQDLLCDDGLEQEQQERASEYRQGIEHRRARSRLRGQRRIVRASLTPANRSG